MKKHAKNQESNVIYMNSNDSQIKQRRDNQDKIKKKKMESQGAKFFVERETRAKLWDLGLLFW